eukprot:907452-Pyramimonas_sp.AAC.1
MERAAVRRARASAGRPPPLPYLEYICSEREILIPLSSYPDSQRKDLLSAEARDIVATGLSYDETDEMPVASRNAEQQ